MATAPGKKSAPLADTHWGESPWRLNQRIDAASQGRFPPRYEELLREYYRALAESDRRE
jgi:hypothetical protein